MSHPRLLLFFFLWWSSPSPAQFFQTQSYDLTDGLPNASVFGVAQDGDGYLWFATRSGIVKYDGLHFEMTQLRAPGNLMFTALKSDVHGDLWALTTGYYIYLYHYRHQTKTWSMIRGPEGFEAERQLNFWVTFIQDAPVILLSEAGSPPFIYEQGSWRSVHELPEGAMVHTPGGGDGVLYLPTNMGLYQYDHRGLSEIPIPSHLSPVAAVIPDQNGVLLHGDGWLGSIQDTQFSLWTYVPRFEGDSLKHRITMFRYGSDHLFIGLRTSVKFLSLDTYEHLYLDQSQGFHSAGIEDMIRDREGNSWFVNTRGVTKVPSFRFTNYDQSAGLLHNEVTSVLHLDESKTLLGHVQGFTYLKGDDTIAIPIASENPNYHRVLDLAPFGENQALAAVTYLGILRLDLDGAEVDTLIEGDDYHCVQTDRHGRIWVGRADGIFRLEDGQLQTIHSFGEKPYVRKAYESRNGDLYFTTSTHGLVLFDGQSWRMYRTGVHQSDNHFAFLEDRQGRKWVGAFAGLYQFRDRLIPVHRQSIKNPVYALAEDHQGRIWVGSDSGVYRLDGGMVRHFSADHGLVGMEANRDAFSVDRLGRMWLGLDKGLSIYQESLDHIPAPTEPLFLNIQVQNDLYGAQTNIRMDHDQNDIVFHTRTLSFIEESRNTLSYRLDGYDQTWYQQSSSTPIRYNNLPSGVYRLNIKATNAHDQVSRVITGPAITIGKPWWQSWWARGMVVLAVFVLAFGVDRVLVNHHYSQQLEKQVAARTREINALNQELEARVRERTAQLEEAHREIVDNAHFAGMAEIATSILHNIGNVLNGVLTTTHLMTERIEGSRLARLNAANTLLRERYDALLELMAEDEKGKMLLNYYLSLDQIQETERETLLQDLRLLGDKLDTIKQIVSQHHNYATGVYGAEDLDLGQLIEISLEIMKPTLEKRNIQLDVDLPNLPDIRVQKNKFIHIMVNLIKNAVEAIPAACPQRRITITARRRGDDIEVHVTDTGEGIAAGDLIKIFRHGFTTKQSGNGFGLHSCATAMVEMGGTIRAESDGANTGATFVLTLPLNAEAKPEASMA